VKRVNWGHPEEGRPPVRKRDEERKAALMQEIEALVDKILSEKPAPDEIDLRDIEQAAVRAGDQVRQAIAQHLLEETEETPAEVRCPGCGKRLGMKDYRSRQVVSEAGEVKLSRAYYYCEACGQGIFPPG
jgi:DNA-directed RNA polymerase subunit RPC12/RpoP